VDHLEKWAATDGGNLSEVSNNASLAAGVVFGRLAVSRSFVRSSEEGFQDLGKTGLPRGSADQASRLA